MTYNESLLKNITGVEEIFTAASVYSDGLWGLGVLLLVMVVILRSMIIRQEPVSNAFIMSGFVGLIIGSFLWILQFVPWEYAVIPVPILILGFTIKFFDA